MAGHLAPLARLRVLTDLGVVAPGCLLHSYVGGTPSTPIQTFSDVALSVPNANPIVASSGGLFGPIYLTDGLDYFFVLTDASGNPIWSQDHVGNPDITATITAAVAAAIAALPAATVNQATAGGRLTLTTLVPVTTADVLAATTLRYTPYTSAQIALYSGAAWALFSFSELSIAVPATTSQLYDVFVFDNAGTRTLELLAWTNDTTRATALVQQDGVLCKSGALTRRYVGSMRTTTVSGQTEDSTVKRYVWNVTNRVARVLRRLEATASWTYSILTWRQMNAAPANQLDVIVGVSEAPITVTATANASSSAADAAYVAIGEDSTTVPSVNALYGKASGTISGQSVNPTATLTVVPAIGRHTYVALEQAAAGGTMTWVGVNSGASAAQSGLLGRMEA